MDIFTRQNERRKMVTGGGHFMRQFDGEEYDDIYKAQIEDEEWYEIDAHDVFVNGAYDEQGEGVNCDFCESDLKWNPDTREWYCPECGKTISRAQWFNDIGARRVPGKKCLTQCQENYPICKKWCPIYKIQDDDPIM